MAPPTGSLRRHQAQLAGIVAAIAAGEASAVTDILAAVTPGGGKSLLPVIAAARLIEAGIVDRICWVVPRDSLRLQAEEAFADTSWRRHLDHGLSLRAADNTADPCRGLAGYVTTYQGIAASPALHLAEFRRHRYLLVIDEMHHLPALRELAADSMVGLPEAGSAAPADDASGWSLALQPLLEMARLRLLLSGTLERADGRGILWLPYRRGPRAGTREIDFEAPGWAVIGYSRAQALADKAVLPVVFGALDGEASWLDETGTPVGPHRLFNHWPTETTRPALFTALRTGFAEEMLQQAFRATRSLRAERRRARDGRRPPADDDAKRPPEGDDASHRGLGKLLVVAPDQAMARQYLDLLRRWVPASQARSVRLATSSELDAHESLASFRRQAEPSILVTVAMAYEGLDAPEVAVVAALTHIRSRPWLEQMVARATRVDPHAGDYATQRALVFHPDDPLFARFRVRIETEQGTLARRPRPRQTQGNLPLWLREQLDERERQEAGIVPLQSNALALRYHQLQPGPDFAMQRPEHEAPQTELLEPPSVIERRLRARVGEMVAIQAIEDEGMLQAPRGVGAAGGAGTLGKQGLYHRYNAVLKRVMGRSRAEMTEAELDAAIGWLERHRLCDHVGLLEGDPRYLWAARQRKASGAAS